MEESVRSGVIYGIHEKKKRCNSYLLLTNCKKAPTRLLHNWVLLWVEATPTAPAQIPVIVLATTRPKHTHATSGSIHTHQACVQFRWVGTKKRDNRRKFQRVGSMKWTGTKLGHQASWDANVALCFLYRFVGDDQV